MRASHEGATPTFRQPREGDVGSLGRGAGSALRVHYELQRQPLVTVGWLCEATNLTAPTIGKALEAAREAASRMPGLSRPACTVVVTLT
jgi:hypothetical protein